MNDLSGAKWQAAQAADQYRQMVAKHRHDGLVVVATLLLGYADTTCPDATVAAIARALAAAHRTETDRMLAELAAIDTAFAELTARPVAFPGLPSHPDHRSDMEG